MMETFDNEFLLEDRLQKIKQIISQYGEENFYISFSGGKDSTVLTALIDQALPGNTIPRVFADTGIEYKLISDFVSDVASEDKRVIILKPEKSIKLMLEEYGYPFKSKEHSAAVATYQKNGMNKWAYTYTHKNNSFGCPEKLLYQFTPDFNIKVSDKCCSKLKKEPLHVWEKENKRPYKILGLRQAEGGRRKDTKCIAFRYDKLYSFSPLAPITDKWLEWFINEYNIKLSKIYYEPYNFERTGCKGCPFNPHLEKDLSKLKEYFPNEYKQCEIIWKSVYDEYRRINYRLKGEDRNGKTI